MKKFYKSHTHPSIRFQESHPNLRDVGFIDLNVSMKGNIDYELEEGKNRKDSSIVMFAFQYFKETFKDDEFYKLRLKK